MTHALGAVWRYRHFVRAGIQGDLAIRFARSRLGTMWSILHPLAQSAIYVIVLAEILGARLPNVAGKAAYPIYLLAGMAAWSLFHEIVSRSLTLFIEHAATLKKLAFPRLCLPLIVWGGAVLNHVLLLAALVVVTICLGRFEAGGWLYLPVGVLLISMFAFGLGILAGVFNVFCRDVGQVFAIVLQLWFWLTPVVYPIEAVPHDLRWLINANPLTPLVAIYQNALLWHAAPDPQSLLRPLVLGVASVWMAWVLFRRAASELVDAL